MPGTDPLATPSDVADLWRPLTTDEIPRVERLIAKASADLRHQCPFDLDERIALFAAGTPDVRALDPALVADVVATIVKRFLVNPAGAASTSDGAGPFSHSATYVNRYDKSGSDVRGELRVTPSDIERLRPAVPGFVPSSVPVGIAPPQVLVPRGGRTNLRGVGFGPGPAVIPDYAPGLGTE